MKKVRNIVLISISIIAIILGIFVFGFVYEAEYKITTISQYTNSNNNYTILFQSVGEPFLFGPAEVKITLLDNKKKEMGILTAHISNDGGRANEGNIHIEWFDGYVEITLSGCEQQDETYRIDYS